MSSVDSSYQKQTSKTLSATASKKGHMRWWLAVGFFFIGLIAYMDRANLAVVAEPMMRDLGLTKVEFGLLGSLFSLGYALTQIPGGIMAERFGTRITVTLSLIAWSFMTFLTALVPKFFWLCFVRFFFGVGEAPTYPSNAVFNSWWFRSTEKARSASFLLAGSYFGPVIAPALTVSIMLMWGWHMVFYIFGGIGLVIALAWFTFSRNRPEEHPLISDAELEYIKAGRTVNEGAKKIKAPWSSFISSVDFWAIGLQYFFSTFSINLFLVWLPTYLQEAKGFSLTHMGIAASFPWLAICVSVLTGGVLSDYLLRKTGSLMIARGSIAIFGCVVFFIGMVATVMTDSPLGTVFWLTLAMGFLGLPVVTSWAITADKGREYAGSVSGWMNLWGNLGGVIAPVLCGWIAQTFGWNSVLLFSLIPVSLSIFCWFLIKPNQPLVMSQRS